MAYSPFDSMCLAVRPSQHGCENSKDSNNGTDNNHGFYRHRFAPWGCEAMMHGRSTEALISINFLEGSDW
jgi:hypothetical protein